MPVQVVSAAALICTGSMGAPGVFLPLPTTMTMAGNMPAANIGNAIPFVEIPPFPTCNMIANPTVAAATAAASGVLTPAACLPTFAGTWVPGASKVMIKNMPALVNTCTLQCIYGGTITITNPGQTKVMAT